MNNLKDKNVIARISILVFCLSIVLISITYAFINITLQGEKKQVITTGNLDLVLDEDENNLTITDALPMYDEVGMKQDPFTFRIINNTTTDTNYILKLVDITTGEALDKTIVKYGLTKNGVGEPALLSTLPDDGTVDSGTIGNKETIEYTLRLWIDASVTNNSVISGKTLSYRVYLEINQVIEKSPNVVELKLFNSNNLGSDCTTYDDGVDTFLAGHCSNNYVWYSGKLWRVVLKNNETGAVKMITDNAMTIMQYNTGSTSNFSNSHADQWLSQEFLPTLDDPSTYLVEDSEWYDTLINSSSPARPTGTPIVRTVGLLNLYEHYVTYTNSDGLASISTTYLSSNSQWWLITKYGLQLYNINNKNDGGTYKHGSPSESRHGIRPVVNLKSTVLVESGTGTINDPYILQGNMQETTNGTTLLNTRYSGDYITLNNELYRIVGTEIVNNELLTKITAVDISSDLTNKVYSASDYKMFTSSDIKTVLENYYQGLATSNVVFYNMIQPNMTWYLGEITTGDSYKLAICASEDATKSMNECTDRTTSTTANIGLPRYGELFTSQISRNENLSFWTLTPYSPQVRVLYYSNGGIYTNYPSSTSNARPSMYLKSNVVIASTNTGNGTYEKPYTIELGA